MHCKMQRDFIAVQEAPKVGSDLAKVVTFGSVNKGDQIEPAISMQQIFAAAIERLETIFHQKALNTDNQVYSV